MDNSLIGPDDRNLPRIEKRILTNHVYDRIKELIDGRDLVPGERVNKRILAHKLGVSQTPVNDALSRLAGEGLVVQENRRGFFVRLPSASDLVELYAVRAALEGMAARLCAELATDQEIEVIALCFEGVSFPLSESETKRYAVCDKRFHNLVVQCSGNQTIKEMAGRFAVIIKSNLLGLVRPPADTIDEHRQLIAALTDRSAQQAQQLMMEHHLRTRRVLERQLAPKNA